MIHSFPALTTMWFVMMSVMMVPTVWPWVSAFNRLGGNTLVFSSGYAGAWLIYSVAAASIQLLLPHHVPPSIAAAILFTAGVFQFVPFKRACLMHCRNPLTYFLTRWRDGASGGFRMGFHHGLFCVACCWALMATTLATGVMSLWWMLLLGIVTLLEQVSRWGEPVRISVGVALLIGAAMQLA